MIFVLLLHIKCQTLKWHSGKQRSSVCREFYKTLHVYNILIYLWHERSRTRTVTNVRSNEDQRVASQDYQMEQGM